MSWRRRRWVAAKPARHSLGLLLILPATVATAGDEFMLGGGVEGESEDGLSTAVVAGIGLTDDTWLTGSLARSSVDLPTRQKLESTYADIDLDHFFDPIGVRIGAAYWGDSDVLDSDDGRVSLYWRGSKAMFSLNYERRAFQFMRQPTDTLPGREFDFDADGIGLNLRFDLTDTVKLRLSSMSYDYSVPFRPIENGDVLRLLSASRLSLFNSLADNRSSVGLGIDHGLSNWTLQLSTFKGVVDKSRTHSVTVRYLFPVTDRNDLELGIGYDDSELYGDVTFFSVFWYFYGGT